METMIKLKRDTREVLNTMKIVERESYDEVIRRLILLSVDNEAALNKATKKMIEERLNSKKEGRVNSINEILENMRKSKDGKM